jgi:hypothetical protein
MDASRFEKCIGKPEESPEVNKLLRDLGVTKRLKPKRGEDTELELPKLGLDIAFRQADPKSSKLVLSGVEFLAGGDGDEQFAGALPGGLKFSDSKQDVYAKLGEPTRAMAEKLRMDHWVVDGIQITVSYARSLAALTSVIIARPYKSIHEKDEAGGDDE